MTNNLEPELNELKDNFEIDKEEEKPKRGRRKKAEVEREQELKLAVAGIGSSVLSIFIERMPNPIPLTEVEKQQFDIVTSNLLSKYLSYLDRWQEESAFALVLLMIIIPRTNIFSKKNEKKNNTDIRTNGVGKDNSL